jgi:RHS repeat-associated protein
MTMPGRKYTAPSSNYRYGFNGKENDNDVKGEGNQQDYGMRIYDPRLGRFLSVDPLTKEYPELTPYQFASNRPIDGIDMDGLEFTKAATKAARTLLKKLAKEFIEVSIKQRMRAYMSKGWAKQLLTDADEIIDILDEGWWSTAAGFIPVVGNAYDGIKTGIELTKAYKKWDKLKDKFKYTENLLNRFGEKFAEGGAKIVKAIDGRGTLRDALKKAGKVADGEIAHHLIPVQALKESEVVQAAVAAGFDFNGTVNGLGVDAKKHNSGGHKNYNKSVLGKLASWAGDMEKKGGYSPEEAKEYLEKTLVPELTNFVKSVDKIK